MNKRYKLWIILSLIVVFLAGVTGGIFIDKYLIKKYPKWVKSERRDGGRSRFPSLEMMSEELGLSPEQQERIREIFRNNEERFKKLGNQIQEQVSGMRIQLRKQIEGVLTPEQKKKFNAILEKYISERKHEMERREEHMEKNNQRRDKGEMK